MGGNPLGRKVAIPGEYSPGVLHAIPREPVAGGGYPVCGLDHWRAYELSWLDAEGRPAVFVGEFLFPADSPNLVESKSLKLYLAGLNGERFARESLAAGRIVEDLSACCGAEVEARVWGLVSYPDNCR
ncbi:MAG: NADPH-dependent 7-cyano-7-deazaguanine reductase QueF, partial [Gammaproteobacteria bacterium]|nr:NADPH-dependent 7-cyano-7-deazaguanine reductase QueF [Gammaproteobacteria bacterium]